MVLGFLRGLLGGGVDPASRLTKEDVLVRMVNLRWWKDRRLRGADRIGLWPLYRYWQTPEAAILDIIETCWWLRDGGLSEHAALLRLRSLTGGGGGPSDPTIRGIVQQAVTRLDPSYLELGAKLFCRQLAMAEQWVRDDIERTKSDGCSLTAEHLREQVEPSDLDPSESTRNLSLVVVRMTDRDELWEYSTPSDGGFALVRDGRIIARIATIRFTRV